MGKWENGGYIRNYCGKWPENCRNLGFSMGKSENSGF